MTASFAGAAGRVPSFDADSRHVAAVVPAFNFEARAPGFDARYLILHYTGMLSAEKAVSWLAAAESRVSCHYVVAEDGRVTQLVPEAMRAWHAGVSKWDGVLDVNSASIGIEIHNPGHELGYPEFPVAQMQAVAALSGDICARNRIAPRHVLAHSDVAPHRKIDPGEKFDWRFLFERSVGLWVEPEAIRDDDRGFEPGYAGAAVVSAQALLAAYGYGVGQSGVLDGETVSVVRAFQRHFRPGRVDGRLDGSTIATLERLLAAVDATPGV